MITNPLGTGFFLVVEQGRDGDLLDDEPVNCSNIGDLRIENCLSYRKFEEKETTIQCSTASKLKLPMHHKKCLKLIMRMKL